MTNKIFYGWWIVFAGFVVIAYAHVVRYNRLVFEAIQWESGLSGTIAPFLFTGIPGILGLLLAGPIVDKKGPRNPMWDGIALMGVSVIFLGFASSSWTIFPLMVLLGLGFGLSISIAPHTAAANWFFNRRCLALAVLVVASKLGSSLEGTVGEFFGQYDWQFALLGMSLLVIGLPLSFLVKHKPEPYGLLPYGDVKDESYQFTLRESLSSRAFWLLTVAVSLSTLALNTSSPALLGLGLLSPSMFEYRWLLLSLPAILGILLFGYIGDLFTKRYLLTATAISLSVGSVIGLITAGLWQFYLYMVFYGVSSGLLPLIFAVRADYFGRESFATISAVMIAIAQLGTTALGLHFRSYGCSSIDYRVGILH